MNQIKQEDGPTATAEASPSDQNKGKGKMVLTLCCMPEEYSDLYPHAVIPFAESYKIACQQAVRKFPAHLVDTEHVLLKYAVQRRDGSYVWSTIGEDDWISILKEDGEEIGVFRLDSDSKHVMIPYDPSKLRKSTLTAINTRIYLSWTYEQDVLVCTDSYEELRNAALEMCKDSALGTKILSHIKLREKKTNQRIGNSGALRYFLTTCQQPLHIDFVTN